MCCETLGGDAPAAYEYLVFMIDGICRCCFAWYLQHLKKVLQVRLPHGRRDHVFLVENVKGGALTSDEAVGQETGKKLQGPESKPIRVCGMQVRWMWVIFGP